MATKIEIRLMADTDSTEGNLPVRAGSSHEVVMPTRVGIHKTELGDVSIIGYKLDRDGIDQHILVNGQLVGETQVVSLDGLTGKGEVQVNAGKAVTMMVDEANVLGKLRDRMVLRDDLMGKPKFPSREQLYRRMIAAGNILNDRSEPKIRAELGMSR